MGVLNGVVVSPIKDKIGTLNYSSEFGYRDLSYNGKSHDGMHYGLDITSIGTVVSVEDGTVIEKRDGVTGYSETESSGNFVAIKHSNNIYTTYCHLDNGSVRVNIGDSVKKGDVLGTVVIKTTGFSTGLHLHFGVNENGDWVNPIDYLQGKKSFKNTSEVNDNIYIVKKGDTLSEIALKYNMNYIDLAKYNNISNPNLILIGQELKIPSIGTDKETTYKVKKGDNLTKIAKIYNMTWQELYEKNKNVIGNNPNVIKPGQILKI